MSYTGVDGRDLTVADKRVESLRSHLTSVPAAHPRPGDPVPPLLPEAGTSPHSPHCQHCGLELETPPPGRAGRPQKYCSVACRQAAHRARRRRSTAQPEHIRRRFRETLHELIERLQHHASEVDRSRLDRYGSEARELVEIAAAVRDVAIAHDRTAGDSWTAIAQRVRSTPGKVQDHCKDGVQLVNSAEHAVARSAYTG